MAVQPGNTSGIDERSFHFLCDVISMVDSIPVSPKTSRLIEQLVDAAGSIGANREEALASSTRREFIRFNEIALRSARESARWLRVCVARHLGHRSEALRLLDEARQMSRILARIVITTKANGLDDP